MNRFSVFKESQQTNHWLNKLLIGSLWLSVILFMVMASLMFMGDWNEGEWRTLLMICGGIVILIIFTIFMQKSMHEPPAPRTMKEYYDWALEAEEAHGVEMAQSIYESIIDKFDEQCGPAYLSLAMCHLEKDEESVAIQYIDQAARENWVWYLPGLELLTTYYHQRGDNDKKEQIQKKIQRVKELEKQASQEITYFEEDDQISPRDQDLQRFIPIIRILRKHMDYHRLYIVKKHLKTIPDRTVYAFAIELDQPKEVAEQEEKIYQDCYQYLAKPLGRYVYFEYTIAFIFLAEHRAKDRLFLRRLREMKDAEIDESILKLYEKSPQMGLSN